MIPSAFPLLPNYIPSNVYSYWVTCIDIWTLWNTRSRLQVLTHIDLYCLPIDPAAPAHIGQNRASQRPHIAYPICNQMSRLNTPISRMLFSAFHHCNRSEKPITLILSFEWTTLHSTGLYSQSPKIEQSGDALSISLSLKGMLNYYP